MKVKFSFFTMGKAMIMTIFVSKFKPFLAPAWLNKNDLGGWLKNMDSRGLPSEVWIRTQTSIFLKKLCAVILMYSQAWKPLSPKVYFLTST